MQLAVLQMIVMVSLQIRNNLSAHRRHRWSEEARITIALYLVPGNNSSNKTRTAMQTGMLTPAATPKIFTRTAGTSICLRVFRHQCPILTAITLRPPLLRPLYRPPRPQEVLSCTAQAVTGSIICIIRTAAAAVPDPAAVTRQATLVDMVTVDHCLALLCITELRDIRFCLVQN